MSSPSLFLSLCVCFWKCVVLQLQFGELVDLYNEAVQAGLGAKLLQRKNFLSRGHYSYLDSKIAKSEEMFYLLNVAGKCFVSDNEHIL